MTRKNNTTNTQLITLVAIRPPTMLQISRNQDEFFCATINHMITCPPFPSPSPSPHHRSSATNPQAPVHREKNSRIPHPPLEFMVWKICLSFSVHNRVGGDVLLSRGGWGRGHRGEKMTSCIPLVNWWRSGDKFD